MNRISQHSPCHVATLQFFLGMMATFDAGIWFSAVTVTTVGYGDKAPISPIGRIVTLVWMFMGIAMCSVFTGFMSTALETSPKWDEVDTHPHTRMHAHAWG